MGSILDPYRDYVDRRFAEGCQSVGTLWSEIRAQGFAGSRRPVRDYVRTLRGGRPRPKPPRPAPRPTVRRCAWWLVLDPGELAPEQRRYVDALTGLCPEVRLVHLLAQEFRRMVRKRDASALGRWANAARRSVLRRVAAGIHADVGAVRAAITLPWSNGQVEGQVNRLKMPKRQMYGRAGFDLLRERVLHAA